MYSSEKLQRNCLLSPSWFLVGLSIVLFSFPAFSQQPAPKPTPTPTPTPVDTDVVKISTNLIQLDVTVVDEKGKVVKDVRADEIEIYENGKKQSITNFSFVSAARGLTKSEAKEAKEAAKIAAKKEPVPVPVTNLRPDQVRRSIALVVDDLSLSFESAAKTRSSLKKFVDEQMIDGDFVAIVRTGAGTGALQQFTADKTILYSAIERVKWNPRGRGGMSAFAPIGPTFSEMVIAESPNPTTPGAANSTAQMDDLQLTSFATGTLGALQYIVEGMAELPGRKSVILFSEGWNMFIIDSFSQTERVNSYQSRVIEAANRAGVVFYPVDTRGVVYTGTTAADQLSVPSASLGSSLPTPQRYGSVTSLRNAELQDSRGGMDILAEETGGFSVMNSNDLAGGVRKVLEDQSYYLVGYEPDSDTFAPATRKFNKIDVKVLRKGLTARYRSGFFNIADERIARQPADGTNSPSFDLRRALMSPFSFNDISVRLNALHGNAKEGSYVHSLVHIEAKDLKFKDEPDGSKKAVIDVWAASFGDAGVPVDQIRKIYTLTVRPEKYQKILDEGFLYFLVFPVKKPGPYQYRIAIRDSHSGRSGSAFQFIQVPNLKKGRLTASSIALENFTMPEWEKLMDPRNNGTPPSSSRESALRKIKLGTILRYGFEVYNAKLDAGRKPNVQTRIRVFLDGKLVLDGKPIPVDLTGQTDMQRVAVSGAMNLSDKMLPGDYILQVIVTDTLAKSKQQIATQHVQFEVVP